ncbi:MAG: CHAD domain-containing protein [Candidatus Aminicenantes bacterium]|nr:CHAD domain-containing protein [Candidatus Aminicenantes bacterium]
MIKREKSGSGFNVQLQPEWPLHKSMVVLLRRLQSGLGANENGIFDDDDPEYLHDFRVAVRRTRSALAQIKNVFPASQTNKWKKKFKRLGRASNRLRDLDVYLLKKEDDRALLPERLKDELEGLFSELKVKRDLEFHNFLLLLKGDFYRRLKEDWNMFLLEQDQEKDIPRSGRISTMDGAHDILHRRWKRVLKKGKRIASDSPDEDLHSLRIECKKLRYSLEFFSSLFPGGEIRHLITRLKKLQDHLGIYNDIQMQKNELDHFIQTRAHQISDENFIRLSTAVERLIARLEEKKETGRASFDRVFKEFAGPENRECFNRLFEMR